jgi:GNAT superfamily N-acetyltransferase
VAYLSLLHLANDHEICEQFLQELAELSGARRFIGPTSISPYLAAGAQLDHWHEVAPFHAPYSPPYLAELLESQLEPAGSSAIFEYDLREMGKPESAGPVRIAPLDVHQLASDLLPLTQAAMTTPYLPPPDLDEVSLVLSWLSNFPLTGQLALMGDEPVGFVLLQPDLARRVRRAGGGRYPWQQLWLQWRMNRPASAGRLLFGAVSPKRRRQGIGRQLWHAALDIARQEGWKRIAIGPVADEGPGASFLSSLGAHPVRHYRLYSWRVQAGGGWW